jgi:hypothetical protein
MTTIISPGIVGPVGDALPFIRLKQSEPHMAMREDPYFSMANSNHFGSVVQDGYSVNPHSNGGGPYTVIEKLFNPDRDTPQGWERSDPVPYPDKTYEPVVGSTGTFNWNNAMANIYQEKITGDAYTPLPGSFEGGFGVPRGGQVPRVIATDQPLGYDLSKRNETVTPNNQVATICTHRSGRRTFNRTRRG